MELVFSVFRVHRAAHIKRFTLWLAETPLLDFAVGSRLEHDPLRLLHRYHYIVYLTIKLDVFFLTLILRHPSFYRWT